jgi:hypothetical protein
MLQTDRVVLVLGPDAETDTVRRVFNACVPHVSVVRQSGLRRFNHRSMGSRPRSRLSSYSTQITLAQFGHCSTGMRRSVFPSGTNARKVAGI